MSAVLDAAIAATATTATTAATVSREKQTR
jgi:hypothetical protein